MTQFIVDVRGPRDIEICLFFYAARNNRPEKGMRWLVLQVLVYESNA